MKQELNVVEKMVLLLLGSIWLVRSTATVGIYDGHPATESDNLTGEIYKVWSYRPWQDYVPAK